MPFRRASGEIAFAASLCALGFLALAALVAWAMGSGSTGPLAAAGSALFASFRWAAFLVPAYLFACAGLLVARGARTRELVALPLALVPFLALTLFLKVVGPAAADGSVLTGALLGALGRVGAPLVTAVATVVTTVLLGLFLAPRPGRRPAEAPPEESRSGGAGASAPSGGALVPVNRPALRLLGRPEESRAERLEERLIEGSPEPAASAGEAEGADSADAPEESSRVGPDDLPAVAEEAAATAPRAHEALEAGDLDDAVDVAADEAEVVVDADEFDAAGEAGETPEPRAAVDEPTEEERGAPEARPQAATAGAEPAAAPGAKPRGRRKGPSGYHFPVKGILKEYADHAYWEIDEATQRAAEVLKDTLEEFNISAEVTGIRKGPVITMFEVLPAPGVKISKIANLADNIALRLAASRVRIVAPIPGKHAVGIEVPNRERSIVGFGEMVSLPEFRDSRFKLPVVLGKGISGEAKIIDLTQTPHILIAGATGAGKSVCVNALICSILYRKSPEEAKLILVDPKIVELKYYNDIPHLLTPVITDTKRAYQALQYCICEMERRYSLLDALGVRDVASYNRKVEGGTTTAQRLPYILFVIDEFADLMAQSGKEMESTVARLAAMSRAVGIHLVLATQRPSVDVITGLIKANIPSRIAFMVASKFDSRIIIDGVGAEKLLGKGDMLFTASWDPLPQRLQGAYLSEEEVEAVANHARTLGEPEYIDDEMFIDEDDDFVLQSGEDDPLMEEALQIVLTAGKASASYLQRRLKIGYNRAARLVEEMEQRGIVGPSQGSKPRDVVHVPDRPR